MNRGFPSYVPLCLRCTLALLAAMCIQSTAQAQSNPEAPQIWVTVTSPTVIQYPRWKGIRTDAPDQWKPEAPWATVAADTQVAKLIAGNIENTHDAYLQVEALRSGLDWSGAYAHPRVASPWHSLRSRAV